MVAVDAAHWPFPFGWLYVAVLGNEVASILAFTAGFMVGRRHIAKHFERVVGRLDHIIKHHPQIPELDQ